MRLNLEIVISFSVSIMLSLSTLPMGASRQMENSHIKLPKKVGLWYRPESPRIIDKTNIFDYMNGAGELYLGYRFQKLEVYEYSAGDSNDILVELYYMETSADSFGLLSLDWEGEPVLLGGASDTSESVSDAAPSSKALYGKGLMRIWADNIYARVMAVLETPESKEAVFTLSRAVFEGQKKPKQPEILKVIPAAIDINWSLQKDRTSFFRSYLVLNSLYYISHQNILNLGLSVDGIAASYRSNKYEDKKNVRLIFIKYESLEEAYEGLSLFIESYVPEEKLKSKEKKTDLIRNIIQLEDGWMGYSLSGSALTLVFESPDEDFVNKIFTKISSSINLEE